MQLKPKEIRMNVKGISIATLMGIVCLGCGAVDESGNGRVSIQIEGARLPPGLISEVKSQLSSPHDFLDVDRLKVVITGPGITEPILVEAEAEAGRIRILNIPAGRDRSISIEALNSLSSPIKRRVLKEITITAGVVAPLKTRLHTIPMFLSPGDGGVVLASSMRIQGYGEPGARLSIASFRTMADPSVSESVGNPAPSEATGIFELTAPKLPLGRQKLTITDEATQESSSITVFVVDANQPGRQLVSAGAQAAAIGLPAGAREVSLPLVMDALNKAPEGER